MGGIQKELEPKGLEVVEAAINENPDVAGFIRQFQVPFPVGTANATAALEYIQWPRGQRVSVPLMVFIDRAGVIRAQYTGGDASFFNFDMAQHIRAEAEKLLNEPPPAKPKPARKKQTRPAAKP